ncbi:hypothetical protein HDU93_006247 [Gonapodya sp. JEL0774]|nr:hypothetical protein HDU93_006247 [Gonapodya sp. JEL0774]
MKEKALSWNCMGLNLPEIVVHDTALGYPRPVSYSTNTDSTSAFSQNTPDNPPALFDSDRDASQRSTLDGRKSPWDAVRARSGVSGTAWDEIRRRNGGGGAGGGVTSAKVEPAVDSSGSSSAENVVSAMNYAMEDDEEEEFKDYIGMGNGGEVNKVRTWEELRKVAGDGQ